MQDAALRISTNPGRYGTDGASLAPFERAPLADVGIPADRLQEAPPESMIDVESQLNNRFDILGKGGVVYGDAESSILRAVRESAPVATPALPTPAKVDEFFRGVSDRMPKSSCDTSFSSFYRFDVNAPEGAPKVQFESERGGVPTRLRAKDAFDECKVKARG
jgi:hypothetical protein